MFYRIIGVIFLFALPLCAQTSFVLPLNRATISGNTGDSNVFMGPGKTNYQPVHVQLIYNSADVPMPAVPILSLAFRRANYNTSLPTNPAASATMAIKMSVGPNDETMASATFANNLGTLVSSVFSGKISLPATPNSGPGAGVFNVKIPFTSPFPFIKSQGKGLVVDIVTTAFTPVASTASWILDAQNHQGRGSRVTNGGSQVNCKFSNNKFSSSISSQGGPKGPGAQFWFNLGNLLPNAPGLHAFGTVGVGGMWGSIFLPLDLTALGAPGCQWKINIIMCWPVNTDTNGNLRYSGYIPNDPALAGVSFFDHAAILDPKANAFGVVTTWSSKWTIGTSPPPGGSKVYKTQDTASSPTGSVNQTAVVIKFN